MSADAWIDTEHVSIGKEYITGPDGREVPCLSIRTYDGEDFIAIVGQVALSALLADVAGTIADILKERE